MAVLPDASGQRTETRGEREREREMGGKPARAVCELHKTGDLCGQIGEIVVEDVPVWFSDR